MPPWPLLAWNPTFRSTDSRSGAVDQQNLVAASLFLRDAARFDTKASYSCASVRRIAVITTERFCAVPIA